MTTTTAPATQQNSNPEVAKNRESTLALRGPRLPYHPAIEERFGVDKASWKALVEAIFPNATCTESVILALSYCRARKLDPFKRNVHIVPIWNKELRAMVDTVWPGIGELRTTAFRTGEYAGRDDSAFGPEIVKQLGSVEMTFPEWAKVTVHRMVKGQRVAFSGPRVYWLETYATAKRGSDEPNEMWRDRPRGQLEKCAEAAALRAAFPEECGSDYIPEEVERGPRMANTVNAAPMTLTDLTKQITDNRSIAKQAADAAEEAPYEPPVHKQTPEEADDKNYNADGEYIGPTQEEAKQESPDDNASLQADASAQEAVDALLEEFSKCASLEAVNKIVNREIESNRWDTAGLDKIDALAEAARNVVRSKRGGKASQQELTGAK